MAKKQQDQESLENVESALTKTEQFIEDNQKLISMAAIALIVIVGGYWAYQKLYMEPLQEEAEETIFHAQQHFQADSFNVALNGDGMNAGFLEIMDTYGSTKTGELAEYYAGVCYLKTGEYESAIDLLTDFSTDEPFLKATARGVAGDAYMEAGDSENAMEWYKKAVEVENDMVTPHYLFKLGLLYEEEGQQEQAIEAYTRIKENFENSYEAREIDKYITRVKISG